MNPSVRPLIHIVLFLTALLGLAGCNLPRPGATPTPAAPSQAGPTQRAVSQPHTVPGALGATAQAANLAGQTLQDVVYCTLGGQNLTLDLYFPSEATAPWPVAMYIHGGAWSAGDKRGGAGYAEVPALRRAGFAVAAANYRLAPAYTFPAMIEDVKCAVRFLRAQAGTYGLAADRFGVWGGSAGGHLAALLGTSDRAAGWDVGPYLDQSSRVQAVVDMFGPADLPQLAAALASTNPREAQRLLSIFNAASPDDPALAAASPATYVSPNDPPFLLFHGDQDAIIPLEQSQTFYTALQQAGVPAQLVVVHNAGHGFRPQGGPLSPSREEITAQVVAFFQKHLGGSNRP